MTASPKQASGTVRPPARGPASAAPASPEGAGAPVGDPGSPADWVGLWQDELPVAGAMQWAVMPSCGAVVTFTGTVRDHSEGRSGVVDLWYEAYAEQVEPRLTAVACAARERWPEIGRLAMLHRVGLLRVTDAAVVVAVSTPNRPAAFEAARFCIDTIKTTVPIWKRETWEGGQSWGTCDHDIVAIPPAGPAAGSAPTVQEGSP